MARRRLTHGSLFTGAGGFDLGMDAAGLRTIWQCEIDEAAKSILAKNWPRVKRYEDVREISGADIDPVDVITFGSPCQDLSQAGRRKGLTTGTRSSLYFEAIRVIQEMKEETNGTYPKIAVWENVKNALSSNSGKDFHAALKAMANIGAMDIGWRMVNTVDFGPPQQRKRVFVVADFGGRRAGEILAHPPRMQRDHSKSRKTQADTAGGIAQSIGDGSDNGVSKPQFYRLVAFGDYRPSQYSSPILQRDYKSATDLIDPGKAGLRPRRLTPRECERLQGWPDDHTRWDRSGNELSDAARYRMIGNGVSAPVAQWIGEAITANVRP